MNKRPKVLILATIAAIGTVLNTALLIVLLATVRHEMRAWNNPPPISLSEMGK